MEITATGSVHAANSWKASIQVFRCKSFETEKEQRMRKQPYPDRLGENSHAKEKVVVRALQVTSPNWDSD